MNVYSWINKIQLSRCYHCSNASSFPCGHLAGTHRPLCLASDPVSSHKSGAEWGSALGAEKDGLKFRKCGRQNFDSSPFAVPWWTVVYIFKKPFLYHQSYMILSVNVHAILVLKNSVFSFRSGSFPSTVLRYLNNMLHGFFFLIPIFT